MKEKKTNMKEKKTNMKEKITNIKIKITNIKIKFYIWGIKRLLKVHQWVFFRIKDHEKRVKMANEICKIGSRLEKIDDSRLAYLKLQIYAQASVYTFYNTLTRRFANPR